MNENDGLAAWVQAFGSIAAIAGAVWVSDRGRQAEAGLRSARRLEMLESIALATRWAHQEYDMVAILAPKGRAPLDLMKETYSSARFDTVTRTLQSIPLFEIADSVIVDELTNMLPLVVEARERLDKCLASTPTLPVPPLELQDLQFLDNGKGAVQHASSRIEHRVARLAGRKPRY